MNASSPLSLVLADCAESVAAERAVWELATRLPPDRFDVRVWLASLTAKQPIASALEDRGIAVDRLPTPGATWSFRRALDVWSSLRRARPTLLHVHFDWPTREGVSAALTEIAGVRHRVVTAHGGRSPHAARGAPRASLDGADLVTTTCEVFADQLARETGFARDRIRRIPAGVDDFDAARETDRAHGFRERLGAGRERPLWVFAGRLDPHRGASVFVEALGIVRERGLAFVAAIAGEGQERPGLEHRLAGLGLDASVHVIDPPEDLGPVLTAADAVVVPSLWDGLSNILIASLARGLPVIASAVGGAPDVIENGVNGRLVPPGDARALADALEGFHRRPEAAARLGREAERRAQSDHEWARVVDAYEGVYDEVLGLASFAPEASAIARGRW